MVFLVLKSRIYGALLWLAKVLEVDYALDVLGYVSPAVCRSKDEPKLPCFHREYAPVCAQLSLGALDTLRGCHVRAISLFRTLRNLMSSRTAATATQDITLLRDAEFQILLWEFFYPPILGLYEKTKSVRAHAGRKA